MIRLLERTVRSRVGYRSPSLFSDPGIQRGLRRYGYHVTDRFVSRECLDELDRAWREYETLDDPPEAEIFHASDPRDRSQASVDLHQRLRCVLVPEIEAITDVSVARALPSVFQIKPSSIDSGLPAHQDSSLVDEEVSFGVYVWVSLTENSPRTGGLFVLPGSHRYGNWIRAASPNDAFEGLHPVIRRHARAISSQPGQIVVFDNALIHGSLVNSSGRTRVAASCVVVPRGADLMIPVIGAAMSEHTVDILRIDCRTLDSGDLPSLTGGDLVESAPLDRLTIGRRGLNAVCVLDRILRPGAPGQLLPELDVRGQSGRSRPEPMADATHAEVASREPARPEISSPVIDESFSAEDVATYYDEWNERYEEVFGEVFQHLKASDHAELLDHMVDLARIADGERLLDAGCGVCGPARHFARACVVRIDAVTVSPVQAARSRALIAADGLTDRIDVHIGDFHHLGEVVTPESPDLVYFLESLVHAHDPAQVLRSAFRVIKPGGRLYIKDFYRGRSADAAEQHVIDECVEATNRICHLTIRNTEDVLQWVTDAGFEIEVSQPLAVSAYSIADGHEFCRRFGLDVAAGRDFTTTFYLDNLEILASKPS